MRLRLRLMLVLVVACAGQVKASELFVGTTPSGPEVRKTLGIPGTSDSELLQWRLSLQGDPRTDQPATFELLCVYGKTAPNVAGIATEEGRVHRKGTWTTQRDPRGPALLVLEGGPRLVQIAPNILHLVGPRDEFLVGNGGWSYTLNGAGGDPIVDPALARNQPDLSYRLSALASGPDVYGVFEGRTPAQGFARVLGLEINAATSKAKWRITLFVQPSTRTPTRYKIEGSLFRSGSREGPWSWEQSRGPDTGLLRLGGAGSPLFLREKGDVLFFLDGNQEYLVGNSDFSYTVDRRTHAVSTGHP